MKRSSVQVGGALCAMLVLAAVAVHGAEAPVDEDAVLGARAAELISSATSRVERVLAVYTFVRDEIKETKAQYG